MKHITRRKLYFSLLLLLAAALCLSACGENKRKKYNTASLDLDIGIGFSHFDNESDHPAPSAEAYLDVYASKIIIRGAYGDEIIETPLIYNNSTTAHPRMKINISGNRIYVIYCPDISLPNLQIASTDNGGESWIQSTLNLSTEKVGTIDNFMASFWSTKSGALVVSNGMVDTFIYFTDDAGKTWTEAESAPPSQNWHNSLYSGGFLSPTIGFTSYNYYSFPPSEPQVYYTLDSGANWNRLMIKVPDSVMKAYSLAGLPYYDGNKINIPIELYDESSALVETVYYVSYDLGENWEFYNDNEGELDLIRNSEREKWFEANRPAVLAEENYFVSDFSLYSSFELEDDVRIDAYKFVAGYDIKDWSKIRLTGDMYFDEYANIYYKDGNGFPILLFVYEGDVFKHTYSLMASTTELQYKTEGEEHIAKRLYEEYSEHKAIKILFEEARKAYALFTEHSKIASTGENKTMEYEGYRYTKVDFSEIIPAEIENLDQLSDYLSTLFSEDIVTSLMSTSAHGNIPLYIEGDDGIYRFDGYVGQLNLSDLDIKLTVLSLESSSATLNAYTEATIYSDLDAIIFDYDYEIFLDSDGKWKMNTFILPEKKISDIFFGVDDGSDMDGNSIDSIDDWDELNYKASGGKQLKEFITAFVDGDSTRLGLISEASDPSVFKEYENLDIISYSISKVTFNDTARILFEYTIGAEQPGASIRTQSGTHSFYVTLGKKGVYLEDTEKTELTAAGQFISDYFSSTLEYIILDCSDLSYSQRTNITEFLAKRASGNATKSKIESLAKIIFDVYDFAPSEDLMSENGDFNKNSRGTRGLCFDIITEKAVDDRTDLTIVIYADRSKLINARTVEICLENNGADFKFVSSYTSGTTEYNICKIVE
ncbi:MAG: hypothetical protein IKJ91_03010 [Clostridia bacterium]|nr:hypothetical protein [Clostridia bacterium]